MAAPENAVKAAPSVADRLRQVAESGKTAPEKKLYIARVVAHAKDGRPAPFHSVTVSTRGTATKPSLPVTFQDEIEPFEVDPRNPERWIRKQRDGARVYLTDEEAAAINERKHEYAVRMLNRGADRAEIIDCGVASVLATLSSATDEPLAPYLTLELA